LGDRAAAFARAAELLETLPKTSPAGRSKLYETEPVGLTDAGGRFLNAVIALDTDLGPHELHRELIRTERSLGKSASHRSDLSRPVDLDLLFYGDEIIETDGLEVPHPRLHTRAFTLIPLVELAPTLVHPKLRVTIDALLGSVPHQDLREVREYTDHHKRREVA
jgi:2-amino-4-hydroxy-6-hydroxymethyldihydropteridine diphosphokinase